MFFPIQGNPYFTSAAALMPMDGVHNATTFPDLSPNTKTVTRTGSAIISTSLGFPAAFFPPGGYIKLSSHADFAIGTGDYTLSFRFRLTERTINYIAVDFRPVSTNGAYPFVLIKSDGTLSFYFSGGDQILSASNTIIANTAYMIVVCRSGSSTKMFVDGIQVGSTYSDASNIPQSDVFVGGNSWSGGFDNGYLWDFYYLRTAIYTANFTPPPNKSLQAYGENRSFYREPYSQPSFLQAARLGL